MKHYPPTISSDDSGIWRQDDPSASRFGIRWSEIYEVHGGKLDGVTEVYTVIELGFEFGEFVEINSDWPGFQEAVAAITRKLPGIDKNWFAHIESLDKDTHGILVWRRP
jgi:hypothetical protein